MKFLHTPEMDQFIRTHYLLPAADLARKFNNEFSTTRTSKQLHQARKARGLKTGRTGQFFKGQARPAGSGTKGKTSTSFKKGQRPHNAAAIGTEVITTKDRYIKVKIANPNVWKFKHVIFWEAVNGKVPAGHVLWFIDQNRQNCDASNLELIPKSEQVHRNKMRINQYPAEAQETVKLIAKVRHKASELGRVL